DHPIALEGELSGCPWNPGHRLLRIGIKGKSIPRDQLPPSNFVLLIDVSGSMSSADKLELAKVAFAKMVQWLQPHDRVAIVTYAGSSGVALPSTPGDQKQTILDALFALQPGGSTNGAEGILTAYQIAEEHFVEGGNNRVILATDGDFNVGISNQNELVALIEEKRASGVFLTVLGFGTGNLQDGKMEQIANHGNGTYEYIDSEKQAEKVFVQEFGKFYTVAKDVKVQIRFNEQTVKAWRLIGYENRLLQNEDFEDDTKDAGEIGAGQCITALYELVPQTVSWSLAPAITVDFRYKQPDSEASIPLTLELFDEDVSFAAASPAQKFAAAVAAWAMLLRESEYAGSATWDLVEDWAQQGMSYDPFGFKAEFLDLVDLARNAP
ncbi:MAG: VWA domain-containing protein, partial [Caldilineae bacterium]